MLGNDPGLSSIEGQTRAVTWPMRFDPAPVGPSPRSGHSTHPATSTNSLKKSNGVSKPE